MLPIKSCRSTLSPLLRLSLLAHVFALAAPGGALAGTRPAAPNRPAAYITAQAGDFSINLYRKGNFVSQATPYWCIGASMQMMLNMVGVTDDDSRAAQEKDMRVARSDRVSSRSSDQEQAPAPR